VETKNLSVRIKDRDEGVVTARFATLDVKDHDGDIIEAGAFGEQRVKVSAYGHGSWGGALPVGVGEIREEGDEALADLAFFMDTTHGRDHFETVKGLGDLGEWSFGFDILEEAAPDEDQRQLGVNRILKKLLVHEVSPVLRGAGVDTATLDVKCDACDAKKKPTDGVDTAVQDEAAEEAARARLLLADG
jgi:phage head maturation protease